MLFGQIKKAEAAEIAEKNREQATLETLSDSEKERLVKELFTGDPHEKVQARFTLDDGRYLRVEDVIKFHDELFAYAEEAKPLVSVGKEIADVEIAKDVALKEAPVEIVKGK